MYVSRPPALLCLVVYFTLCAPEVLDPRIRRPKGPGKVPSPEIVMIPMLACQMRHQRGIFASEYHPVILQQKRVPSLFLPSKALTPAVENGGPRCCCIACFVSIFRVASFHV